MGFFSTFDPFVSMLWQAAIGSCPISTDSLDPCFWQGLVWWLS
jgi:hypothetical protein